MGKSVMANFLANAERPYHSACSLENEVVKADLLV